MTEAEIRLKDLMCRGLTGDAKAHAEMLGGIAKLLRAYFANRLGAWASQQEDLVQETLVSIHTRRTSYDVTRPILPWVYAIARYRLIDFFRAQKIRATVPLDDMNEPTVESGAQAADATRDVSRLLARLPEKQRRLITLIKLEGLSVDEAATRLGMSETAAKVSVHRGLKIMRRHVENHGGVKVGDNENG